ncbi:MAG: nucleotide-binding protein [Clostridia bacterium]|nr:nucleotide-binding protein [Clostridia bacterium]
MKGRIFIAWSGTNDIALKVKDYLETQDYTGVVGGAARATTGLFVGHTVLDEINHCNQAIFIVQKKDNGNISNNLMFEFGYSLAKFNSNKIHVFYVDIDQNDDTIPSDIQGIWADYYNTKNCTDVAKTITEKFLSDQKYIIPEDKMSVVNNYYGIKDLLLHYTESPKCSEYELAQYILFFAIASYMHTNEKEALACLQDFTKRLYNPSKELALAASLAICYIETLSCIQKTAETLFLKKEDFRTANRKLGNMAEEVELWEEDDFSQWLLVIIYDVINYAQILYASNPDTKPERREAYLRESINYAENCLAICDKLLMSPQNQHFTELFKAYMYRNLATAHKMLNSDDNTIRALLSSSYKMRESLWDHYNEAQRINAIILENFEMEYFLALSEELEYMEDELDRDDFKEECEDYILRVQAANREKSHFIHKIELNIKNNED